MGTNSIDFARPKRRKPKIKKFRDLVIKYEECEHCAGRGIYEFTTHYTTLEECSPCNGTGYIEIPNKTLQKYRKFLNGDEK